jgi:hypothetical protein
LLVQKRNWCPAGSSVVELIVEINVVLFQININTYIEENTIININGGRSALANQSKPNFSCKNFADMYSYLRYYYQYQQRTDNFNHLRHRHDYDHRYFNCYYHFVSYSSLVGDDVSLTWVSGSQITLSQRLSSSLHKFL